MYMKIEVDWYKKNDVIIIFVKCENMAFGDNIANANTIYRTYTVVS